MFECTIVGDIVPLSLRVMCVSDISIAQCGIEII